MVVSEKEMEKSWRVLFPPDALFKQPHRRSVKKTDKDLVLGEMSFGLETPFVTLFPSRESILNQARRMLSTWESQGCQQIKPLQSTHPALWLVYQQIMLSLLIMLFDCWMKLLAQWELSHKRSQFVLFKPTNSFQPKRECFAIALVKNDLERESFTVTFVKL